MRRGMASGAQLIGPQRQRPRLERAGKRTQERNGGCGEVTLNSEQHHLVMTSRPPHIRRTPRGGFRKVDFQHMCTVLYLNIECPVKKGHLRTTPPSSGKQCCNLVTIKMNRSERRRLDGATCSGFFFLLLEESVLKCALGTLCLYPSSHPPLAPHDIFSPSLSISPSPPPPEHPD